MDCSRSIFDFVACSLAQVGRVFVLCERLYPDQCGSVLSFIGCEGVDSRCCSYHNRYEVGVFGVQMFGRLFRFVSDEVTKKGKKKKKKEGKKGEEDSIRKLYSELDMIDSKQPACGSFLTISSNLAWL